MKRLSFVIPVFNESGNLTPLLAALKVETAQTGLNFEIIFVEDGSTDDSWRIIRALAHADPMVKAVRLSRNFGKDAALAAGLDIAAGDAVVIMDADLQHPPSLVAEMARRWQANGAEIVEAVKANRGRESFVYRQCATLFYGLFQRLSGIPLRGQSDFCLLDGRVVQAWRRLGEHKLFFKGTVAWLGFKREQVEYDVAPRSSGQSGWTPWKLYRSAIIGIVSFSSLPLHLVTIIGFCFLCFALALGGRAIYIKFHYGLVDGITTVILLLLFIGSIIMIAFGIVGEYIARIFDEVKSRPRYIVRETIGDPSDNGR